MTRVQRLRKSIWENGIGASATRAAEQAKKVKQIIKITVPALYKDVTPFQLKTKVIAKISPVMNTMVQDAAINYNQVVAATDKLLALDIQTSFTKADLKALGAKRAIFLDDLKFNNDALENDIKGMVLSGLGRGDKSYAEMIQELEDLYPAYDSYIETLVNTTLQDTYRDAMFTKYEEVGMEYYKYSGPDDSKTRPYCEEHVNKVYTASEARQIMAVMLGLYNCRHELLPITQEEYDAEVEAGNQGEV